MEERRNCGFVEIKQKQLQPIVWARKDTGISECPVSFITADSCDWLEQFHLWRMTAKASLLELPAKTGEAIALLENEWREEINETAKSTNRTC